MKRLPRGFDTIDCNCGALRCAARRITHAYDAKLARAGLTAAQFSLLGALYRIGTTSVNSLADVAELDRTTAGKNARVLQRRGLVKIGRSREDGRSRAISMTAKGLEALTEAAPLWREAQREFEEHLGKTRAATLRPMLTNLGRNAG